MGSRSVLYRLYRFCVPVLRGAGAPLGGYILFRYADSLVKKILIIACNRLTASGRSFSFLPLRSGGGLPSVLAVFQLVTFYGGGLFCLPCFSVVCVVSRLNAVYLRLVYF